MNQIKISKQLKIAFVKARWHAAIVDQCEHGFRAEIAAQGFDCTHVHAFEAPGAFDIPLLAKKLAQSGSFDAIVAAGFVVDGGIYRHEFVASVVIDGLMQVQLETGIPVISAVLTPHQFQEAIVHEDFFSEHFVEKGKEAASACMQIMQSFDQLSRQLAG